LLATDFFHAPAYPTFLYYNPHATTQEVEVDVGNQSRRLYDATTGQFIGGEVSRVTKFTVPADSARVLVICPAQGGLGQAGDKVCLRGHHRLSAWPCGHRCGCPARLWESRYFDGPTNAVASAKAANGFTVRESFLMGTDPANPDSILAFDHIKREADGRCELSWKSVADARMRSNMGHARGQSIPCGRGPDSASRRQRRQFL